MSEIPEDIVEAAAELVADLNVCSLKAFVPEEGYEIVERALLAHERAIIERCATIADDFDQAPGDDTPMGPLMAAQVAIAQTISANIRETAR